MLARTTLAKWVNEGIIRSSRSRHITSELKRIDPGLFNT
jgi:hypothetical protein